MSFWLNRHQERVHGHQGFDRGRLAAPATVIGALGLGIPVLVILDNSLPAGRYPKLLFMIPTVVIGLAIFFGCARLLRAMGKAITKPPMAP